MKHLNNCDEHDEPYSKRPKLDVAIDALTAPAIQFAIAVLTAPAIQSAFAAPATPVAQSATAAPTTPAGPKPVHIFFLQKHAVPPKTGSSSLHELLVTLLTHTTAAVSCIVHSTSIQNRCY
jgi:hypothetical protein